MSCKALIFDLDGTLLNTIDDLGDSANHILCKLGFPTHTIEEYKYFVGNGIPKLIERCLPPDRQEYKEQALAMFMEYYSAHSRIRPPPMTAYPSFYVPPVKRYEARCHNQQGTRYSTAGRSAFFRRRRVRLYKRT